MKGFCESHKKFTWACPFCRIMKNLKEEEEENSSRKPTDTELLDWFEEELKTHKLIIYTDFNKPILSLSLGQQSLRDGLESMMGYPIGTKALRKKLGKYK